MSPSPPLELRRVARGCRSQFDRKTRLPSDYSSESPCLFSLKSQRGGFASDQSLSPAALLMTSRSERAIPSGSAASVASSSQAHEPVPSCQL